ncbi:hypothetical protein BCR22_02245 [Enterococcus plantarum]|uniref:WxL domain-containing protein n=1 Tax=Enterococcus plantarum TaxID=1077675 RepID=UPI00084D2372|nr:WxL domain-containing protein [Enterococcus plantarum]OEG17499.1 hypothetical protein BCR22_02245 [Enterococcus plantarum]
MKLTHKLCGAALLAAVGIAAALPANTKADDGVALEGKADIEFSSTASSSTSFTNTSGSGDDIVTSGGPTSDANGFGVSYVTDINFGKHDIVAGAEAGPYWATKWIGNEGKEDQVEGSHFVNFEDVRSVADHSYTLSATLSKQFTTTIGTSTKKKLNGATLSYKNVAVREQAKEAVTGFEAGAVKDTVTLSEGNIATFIDNANGTGEETFDKGYGRYTLYFGKYEVAAPDATSAEQSIQLTVPKEENTVINNGKYTAEISWVLATTPTNP